MSQAGPRKCASGPTIVSISLSLPHASHFGMRFTIAFPPTNEAG